MILRKVLEKNVVITITASKYRMLNLSDPNEKGK
jgi:hypothetical protein